MLPSIPVCISPLFLTTCSNNLLYHQTQGKERTPVFPSGSEKAEAVRTSGWEGAARQRRGFEGDKSDVDSIYATSWFHCPWFLLQDSSCSKNTGRTSAYLLCFYALPLLILPSKATLRNKILCLAQVKYSICD